MNLRICRAHVKGRKHKIDSPFISSTCLANAFCLHRTFPLGVYSTQLTSVTQAIIFLSLRLGLRNVARRSGLLTKKQTSQKENKYESIIMLPIRVPRDSAPRAKYFSSLQELSNTAHENEHPLPSPLRYYNSKASHKTNKKMVGGVVQPIKMTRPKHLCTTT